MRKGQLIERQVIVTWHTPEEKLPPVGEIVVASISGRRGDISYDHAYLCHLMVLW